MDISLVPLGANPPHELNVIIEVPMGGDPVKYEIDKTSGAIFVDRMLHTAMYYPCNYGFIPHTLSADGDPLDVLVYCDERLISGCVISVRPIGVLIMEDEAGQDEKLLAVPVKQVSPIHANKESYQDIPEIKLQQIAHFFSHYKDLEKNKWVKVIGWEGVETAQRVIEEAIALAAQKK
ncbi:inorganic diphosphatase [Candidatus Odyssella acanthamoebae]|uniref:Inorganic pyrophosphatase n=1 Tax=Candidatus Odyssella acanthamoebae TaxID=91604 RepID=A0A077AXW9_9PROT|nr:inorganic diphosphatase [Candidatus Paracaedibacter acanthamoebae]AIK95585.1 inorganic pyrophosphatase [Candidatus Paracaedibacter acanthamoebae]